MTEWGHIKISRKAYATDLWWNEPRIYSKWEAWEDCIQMAAWQDYERSSPMGIISVKRGEFIASHSFLAARWGWNRVTCRRYLDCAQRMTRLRTQRVTPLGTLYLLVNYSTWQGGRRGSDTPSDPEVTQNTAQNCTQPCAPIEAISNKQIKELLTLGLEPNGSGNGHARPAPKPNWVTEAVHLYAEHRGVIGPGKLGKILKPLVAEHGWTVVGPVFAYWCQFAPVQDFLVRAESGQLKHGEKPVAKLGYNTNLTAFVESFAIIRKQAGL